MSETILMDNVIGSVDTCKPENVQTVPVTGCNGATLGRHLARRLVEIGVTDVFSVPGDFNLTLLDHLVAEPGLDLISCCNELNAGYAADGYARSRGVGACVVTFTIGGLSVINAIAGSIGCSVGATLGYAQAKPEKRVFAFVGDGSFQVTAQEISTVLRTNQKNIIFIVNNGGYTIEVEIHDGPYNVIKNWDYTGFVDAIHNGEGKCWTAKVRTLIESSRPFVLFL
uniref:pyruvate decarboxylase n=1 Tax=Noccaea caerulescens TaxID=107243 RepID=A0A1J3FRN8_NOCCA